MFKNFNEVIENKLLVVMHEIHSEDVNLRQNGERMKELVANDRITIRRKFKDEQSRRNNIHWFGATNERKPFALAHGNDRFYFAEAEAGLPRSFFGKNIPQWRAPLALDKLFAGALAWKPKYPMSGRAPEQRGVWKELESASRRAWEQNALDLLDGLEPPADKPKQPICFFVERLHNLLRKHTPNLGIDDLRSFLNAQGYQRARRVKPPKDRQMWAWTETEHVAAIADASVTPGISSFVLKGEDAS